MHSQSLPRNREAGTSSPLEARNGSSPALSKLQLIKMWRRHRSGRLDKDGLTKDDRSKPARVDACWIESATGAKLMFGSEAQVRERSPGPGGLRVGPKASGEGVLFDIGAGGGASVSRVEAELAPWPASVGSPFL